MANGGIYDHIGSGFTRYSTDEKWLVPHFEKMLYDNALLINAYTEAYQITQHPEYEKLVHDLIQFIKRDMMNRDSSFIPQSMPIQKEKKGNITFGQKGDHDPFRR